MIRSAAPVVQRWLATACVVVICGASCGTADARRLAGIRFSPASNGFAFENYGNTAGITNLTPLQMQLLFGSAVCASGSGASCLLSPPALEWMITQNQLMGGGHCEGLSFSSLLFARRTLNPAAFGGRVPKLKLGGNATLQELIAYTYALGSLDSVAQAAVTAASPTAVVQQLIAALKSGQKQWVLHIFKPDMSGGHAVTPYAVDSLGKGRYGIRIYDSNWPQEVRTIKVDSRSDTWRYQAGDDPRDTTELYAGTTGSGTLQLWNLMPGLSLQPCPFCASGLAVATAAAARRPAGKRLQVVLTGEGGASSRARPLVRGAAGRVGYRGHGRFFNRLKGARVRWVTNGGPSTWTNPAVPVLDLPAGDKYTISLQGRGHTSATPAQHALSIIGPRFSSAVQGLALNGNDAERVTTSAGGALTFRPLKGAAQSPRLSLGVTGTGGEYMLTVTPQGLTSGQALGVAANTTTQALTITPPSQGQAQLSFQVDRENADGSTDVFASGPVINAAAGQGLTVVQYGAWAGGNSPMSVQQGSNPPMLIPNQPWLAVEQDPNGGFGTVPAGMLGTGPVVPGDGPPSTDAPLPPATPVAVPPLSFAAASNQALASRPAAVTAGDLNGDGRPDLAVALDSVGAVAVSLGNGDGTFQSAHSYPVAGAPRSLAISDFNGDGKPDLAVANRPRRNWGCGEGSDRGSLSLLFGNGDGSFQPQHVLAVGRCPRAVTAGDFNGDSKPDLAIADGTENTVSVFLGNGDGSFGIRHSYAVASRPSGIAAGDFDGDSDLDLALTNGYASTVSVLPGNGDGTFAAAQAHAVGVIPLAVAAGDLDGDGNVDLAVADMGSRTVSVLEGNGDGTFRIETPFVVGSYPSSLTIADLDGDHQPDLVTASKADNTLSVLLNTTRTT